MNYEYCDGMTHTIKQGDTLYSISRLHKVPLGILLRANPYVDVYNLQIGDTICIPVKNQACRPGMPCRPNRPNRPNRPVQRPDGDDDMYDDDRYDDDDMYDKDDDRYDDDDMYDKDDGRYDDDDMYDKDDDRYRNGEDTDGIRMSIKDNDRSTGGIRMSANENGRNAGLGIRTDMSGNDDRQDYGMGNMADNMNNGMSSNGNMAGDMNNGMNSNRNMAGNMNNGMNGVGSRRVKYVSQSGDTLQDLFDRSAGGEETFWEMNSPDGMYLLAGVAYHIIED